MNRSTAVALTKKALEVAAERIDLQESDMRHLKGQTAEVNVESIGGNHIATIKGKVKLGQGFSFSCASGKAKVTQPYGRPAKVVKDDYYGVDAIVMEDTGIRWIIEPA